MLLNIDDILADASIGGYSANVAISNTTALTVLSVLSALYEYRRYWTNDIDELDDADIDTIDELLSLANYELMTPIEVSNMIVGSTVLWWTDTAPADYLICDGTQYLKSLYPELAATLGTPFEVDANNFVVPDMRDRVVVGKSATRAINDSGGEETHTLTESQMPNHNHGLLSVAAEYSGGGGATIPGGTGLLSFIDASAVTPPGTPKFDFAPLQGAVGAAVTTPSTNAFTRTAGSGGSHNNMQPYLTAQYIIKAM